LSASAPSSQDLSLAAFIINIAESDFRHTQHILLGGYDCACYATILRQYVGG
jgi:hypothetical protein